MTRRNRVEKRRWRHETMWYSSSDFKLQVLIPDDLADDMKAKVAAAKNIRKWEQISVEAPETRAYEFFADVKFRAGKTAILQDVPTALLSLHQTITEFLKLSHV